MRTIIEAILVQTIRYPYPLCGYAVDTYRVRVAQAAKRQGRKAPGAASIRQSPCRLRHRMKCVAAAIGRAGTRINRKGSGAVERKPYERLPTFRPRCTSTAAGSHHRFASGMIDSYAT
ncbi:hypothetical protein [Burkholderia pseudomallei]|uniref:hypothetical protein n=1 Tax=Burkholderia pseudomallei TaxID=28450 RepID=UPI000433F5AA|nr:hypothetical protein [Burkholderia pseudomallei]EXJ03334.1 hypothetical protein T210_0103830 [Burkholderia pseudomallei MSHR6137]ARK93427.1 hypothetical protein BOC43_02170 [Burkholderia pseudomallei]AYE32383.1 hypothetical protein CNX72_36120 [Burkholderia pseudomallei]KAA8766531.1 hypothetical protein F5D26_19200 [Burkholderia pseudomallei]KGS30020.1 hypothetical protein X941_3088 [Burkholderia pseudomallei MSHR5569]